MQSVLNGVELTMESYVKLLGIEIDSKLNFQYLQKSQQLVIWHFSSKKSKNKMEKIHERSLKFLSNDYLNSYAELLEKSSSV